jgi:hypothetical protein
MAEDARQGGKEGETPYEAKKRTAGVCIVTGQLKIR